MMKENNEEINVQNLNGANHAELNTNSITDKNELSGKEKKVNNLSIPSEKNISEKAASKKMAKKNIEKKSTDESLEPKQKTKKSTIKTPAKKSTALPIVSTESTGKKRETKKKTSGSEIQKEIKKDVTPFNEPELKKTPAAKKITSKKKTQATEVKLTFNVRFHTQVGQTLYITGNNEVFGNNDINKALPMQYLNEELWTLSLDLNTASIPADGIIYNYIVKNEDGDVNFDWGTDKKITSTLLTSQETLIIDAWNFAGYYENAFYTEPFKQVLLKNNYTPVKITPPTNFTHVFKVKAPLLEKGQTVFIAGNTREFGDWGNEEIILMNREENEDFYSVKLDLSKVSFPVVYKYGVYDTAAKKVIRFEDGNNRLLHDAFIKTKKTIVNDGFAILPSDTWKGAGVSIPVFSLRTGNSCGVGEFTDIKLLADWAKATGLKLIQILPVNDTTATHTWTDSYPYAAISAFALHPMYLNLYHATDKTNIHLLNEIADEQKRLNKLDTLDYDAVNKLKWRIIRQLYPLQKDALFASAEYQQFFELNKHWLTPYAAFCYFRDKYNTADFNQWASHKTYNAKDVEELLRPSSPTYNALAIYFFVQYYLYVQLKEATQYAHDNGIIVKGDIPIGIYRYGADGWQHPELYHMDVQAGAPPDDFAVTGQNWGFPTYNWEKMREDGFAWWKQRFEEMSNYFDAFRIDHILGFFRIWSIPYHSVEGIMGHFEPAIPVYKEEFAERQIWFDYNRYCHPYITEQVLNDMFGDQKHHVIKTFIKDNGSGQYQLKQEFATQRQVENYFSWREDNEHNRWLKKQLFHLISNVILFEVDNSQGKEFHFRFAMQETLSFKSLDAGTKYQLNELYLDYFFGRQDNFWKHEAIQKLPALKRETNMLVCGEDLGLVPASVPEVMRQLGILSLEIQRMPKDPKRRFFHPADAPYLSVVTPSTHDISTIRGWWEEDRENTQRFFNDELGQWGDAPYFCDAWINKAIVVQHLYSPAMWSIFQLQDLLGMDVKIRRANPHEERINVPANPKHYWKYRIHLNIEDLINAAEFNKELADLVKASGRS
jgi:4-alpha-glucanotransferase